MAIAIPLPPTAHGARRVALDYDARQLADLDPVEAEATIDALVADAIATWRLTDATYWQRVKFRARLLRSMRRAEPNTRGGSNIFTASCEG